jgi:hypothetical protein
VGSFGGEGLVSSLRSHWRLAEIVNTSRSTVRAMASDPCREVRPDHFVAMPIGVHRDGGRCSTPGLVELLCERS